MVPLSFIRRASVTMAVLLAFNGEPSLWRTAPQRDPGPVRRPTASVSRDGAFIAFESFARLSAADSNSASLSDIYVLDVNNGTIELISINQAGSGSDGTSSSPRLNHDGRYVVFESVASNLVSERAPACTTVFLRDRLQGTTRAVARERESERLLCAHQPSLSDDGRFVAFESSATDLVVGSDANADSADVYVLDLTTGVSSRVSVDDRGVQHPIGRSYSAAISGNGRFVAFTSTACLNRALPRPEHERRKDCPAQIYVRDRLTARTRPIATITGQSPNQPTHSAAISADGRFIAFASTATNLERRDVNGVNQVYLFDTETGVIELVSRTAKGRPGNGESGRPALSSDGRFVAFQSVASDLICSRCGPGDRDQNLVDDVFLLDRQRSRMRRLSEGPGRDSWWTASVGPVMDGAARVLAFSSRHPTGTADDRADFDLFIFRVSRAMGDAALQTLADPDAHLRLRRSRGGKL
jgi:Tol biopolymer transport system component